MIRTITTILGALTATALAAGPAHADPRTWLNEGTQVVGTDVLPGLYHTDGPLSNDHGYCFITWLPYLGARDSAATDIQSYDGPGYVRLEAGEVIEVDGCAWVHENYHP
ncbi:hypothetical protein [Nocardia aurantia]|uniref:Uncharacterized protein n=1 Tax=Nocardia aurantia TaxID=2585199 RepID=A0A7K0DUP7_9NOCA|nr:hypothetical protein [Nocardia aurantia]MQY29481.1 hypothetical protein [Nocardia aurantia]